MIDLEAMRATRLHSDPFPYAEVRDPLSPASVAALTESMPSEGCFRSTRHEGSDKTYRVINNVLFTLEEQSENPRNTLAAPWRELLADLRSAAYIEAASALLGIALGSCHREITLKRYRRGDFISLHTDSAAVSATHLFFLNRHWRPSWGGLLCFHDDGGEVFRAFPPLCDSSVLFARSPRSWHSVTAVDVDDAERLSLQVVFWKSRTRDVAPGRREERVDD